MAIKRIPIKGISRDPSGQISAEGMCAESLNVQLDMGEIAPMMAPKPVVEFGDLSVDGDILYIHKGVGLGYENLICLAGTNLIAYKSGGGILPLYSYVSEPSIKSVTHVGNTLIVSEGDNLRYFLYKDNEYHHLGTKIPIPAIWFGSKQTNTGWGVGTGLRVDASTVYPYRAPVPDGQGGTVNKWLSDIDPYKTAAHPAGTLQADEWSKKAYDYVPEDGDVLEILSRIWGVIDEEYKNKTANGEAIFPLFVRYAVRLYDDSLYACSVPILLGGDVTKFIDVKLTSRWQDETYVNPDGRVLHYWNVYANVGLVKPFIVIADYTSAQLATAYHNWGDIVKSIDIFFSDQMFPVKRRDAIQLTNVDVYDKEAETEDWRGVHADGLLDPCYTDEELLRDHQETYLVKSIKFEDFGDYTGVVEMDDVNLTSDWILNQEALGESYLSHHQWLSDNITSYNNSLLLSGVTLRLSSGHPFHVATKWKNSEPESTDFVYVFHINIGGQTCYVFSRNPQGGTEIIAKASDDVVYPYTSTYYEQATAWIAYPDARCSSVDVLTYTGGQYYYLGSLIMSPLGTQDVSYAFVGFGQSLISVPGGSTPPRYNTEEIKEVALYNTLIQSKGSNPFVTTPSGVITLSGSVINVGMVTTPLSEGQAGQFHLYVFTTEGIFALTSNSTGVLVYSHAVSRDILLNRNSVIGIEQAIFFASARGLMLLQGSSITKVSELMDGKPDSLSDGLAQDIVGRFFSGTPIEETTPFYQFLNGCRMAYDYANSRIILFRERQSDMYVYKFDTQSWHRMAWSPLSAPVRTINSYPEAFIVEQDEDNRQSLMNYSILAEEPEAVPLPGLIYTRELALDAQDFYKTIERLKIRGRYADGHVKWALQGSNDGVNYRTLHSLRGPSWKWYRIAIITLLEAQERISYIELDVNNKFVNKLR